MKEGTNPILLRSPFVNQETGRFDATQLTKFLSDYKRSLKNSQLAESYEKVYKYWQFLEKQLRQQTLAQKYQALIANCLISNPISAKMAFEGQNQESDIQLASIAYSTINDNDVKIDDKDLKAKYDEQKEMFKQTSSPIQVLQLPSVLILSTSQLSSILLLSVRPQRLSRRRVTTP